MVKYILLAKILFYPSSNYAVIGYLSGLHKKWIYLMQGFLTKHFFNYQEMDCVIYCYTLCLAEKIFLLEEIIEILSDISQCSCSLLYLWPI